MTDIVGPDDYKDAIDIQDACNLSGVVRSMVDVLGKLWNEAHAEHVGTDWVNRHPISVMYADKIASLTGVQSLSEDNAFHDAYKICRQRAGLED